MNDADGIVKQMDQNPCPEGTARNDSIAQADAGDEGEGGLHQVPMHQRKHEGRG